MKIDNINKLNTINEVEDLRKRVNEACDARVSFIKRCVKANELSEKPFGYIKEAFEAISPALFNSEKGKKILNKYSKTIRENKNLSSLHTLCETIRKAGKDTDSDFLVNSIANETWVVDKKTLAEDVKKIGRILAEGYILAGTEDMLPEERKEVLTALNFIAENKKSKKNLAEYGDAVKIIRESIKENESSSNISKYKTLDEAIENILDNFNGKYAGTLTEDEIKIIKEVSDSKDKEQLFDKYKSECQAKISEAKANFEKNGDNDSAKRLSVVLEQISNKKYSLDTVNNDICSLINLSKIF